MIALNKYIFESQPVGELLTFDEFSDFFNTENGEKIKDKIENKFPGKSKTEIKVLNKYLGKWATELYNCLPDYFEIDDNLLKLVYNQLKETPVSKLEKIISSGEEACVFELKDKVLKCYYNHKIPNDRKKFFDICKEGKYEIFPKVYRIGKDYVVMEKLQMETPKCKKYFDIIDSNKHGDTVYHLVQDFKENEIEWTKDEQEVVDWMLKVREAVGDAYGEDPKTNTNYGDLQLANVGERADNTIVFFDI